MSDAALITGGANGIGRAVALKLAANGISVVIADQDEAAAEEVRSAILAGGGRAEVARVDVTKAAEVKEVVAAVFQRHGRIDVLANIAGGSIHRKRLEELSWAEWKEVLDVNLKGTFLFCREVAPIMQGQRRGRIINTASNYGITGSALRTPYSAAKAGVIAFSKSLALELAPYGVLVNVVAPGPTDTPRVMRNWTPETRKQRNAEIPLGRTGRPDDLAEAFYFLSSLESSSITGQTLHVNGGLVMP
ncbi:MAG: SDR family oxidoreductase [Deltaproteobacteria bacterium]|nr:SDR family oxidoreductase [Deltaproteobacteria bacterium]